MKKSRYQLRIEYWRVMRFLGLILMLLSFSGCGLALPSFRNPGHINYQRLRATHYDPYATTDGAHEFEGGRPPSFDQPRSQPEKSQWTLDVR